MNIGAVLTMQNLGQVSGKGLSQRNQGQDQETFFSTLLTKAVGGEGKPDQAHTGALQIFKILQILHSGTEPILEGTQVPDANIENILSQEGITKEDFLMVLESIMNSLLKETPLLKEELPALDEENQEMILFKIIESLSLMPQEILKKLDLPSMEMLFRTSKAFEQAYKQVDLSFQQTERAEALQQNLKNITQKVEQLLTGENLKNGKWDQILQNVYRYNFNYKESDSLAKNSFQHAALNANSTQPANKSLLSMQLNPAQSPGDKTVMIEGEQTAKSNASITLNGFFGQQHLARVEQFSLSVNKSQTGTTYEQFIKDFANIIGKSQMVQTPNMSKLLIKLYPEQLGSLRIELLQQDGIMTAKILASTKAAKDILDSQLTGLRQALTSQNLQVDKIEIAQTFTELQRQERQPSQQQNGQQPKDQSDQQSSDKEELESTFKELLMNSEV
jgi:flagellar hook-length control protein FliK